MQIKDLNLNLYYLICGFFLATGFTLIGAGPSELENSSLILFFYWSLHISVSLSIYVIFTQFCFNHKPNSWTYIKTFVLASIVSALIFAALAIFLELPFFDLRLNKETFFLSILDELFPAASESLFFWYLINLPFLMKHIKPSEVAFKETPKPDLPEKNLFIRKDESLFVKKVQEFESGELYAIKSEANYLRLYFKESSELVLCTLKNAVSELSNGMQVHRSYWVSSQSIDKKHYVNKKLFLKLKNGIDVPVGRVFSKDVVQFFKN